MYLKHWGLSRRPFDNSQALELFVPVESAMLGLTKLRYCAAMGLGAACIYGPSGSGKSELLRMAMRDFRNSGWATAYIANPSGPREEVFRNLLRQYEGGAEGCGSALEALERRLLELAHAGGRTLLVVDEAHSVRDLALLEELRMLMNLEHEGAPALSILLGGQHGVLERLAEAGSFDARLAMKIRALPYTEEESEAYMLARLKSAGCTRGIFTRQAACMVYEASGGLPGNINRICELALVTASSTGSDRIRPELVRVIASELGLRNDAGTQRMLDEIWSDDIPPIEAAAAPEIDVLAELNSGAL